MFRQDYTYISLLLMAPFALYPYALISIVTALFPILVSVEYIRKGGGFIFSNKKWRLNATLYIILLIYLILLISSIYSENSGNSIKELLRLLPFLVIPGSILICSPTLSKRKISNIKWIYVFSILILIVIIYGKAIILQESLDKDFFNIVKSINNFDLYIDVHPSYLSLFIIVSIVILLDQFNKASNTQVNKILYLFLILLLTFTVLILSSRMMILNLLIGFIFFIPKLKYKLLVILSLILLGTILIRYVNPLNYQYNDFMKSKLELPTEKFPSSIKMRYAILHCSWGIIKDKSLLGVGIGDLQDELNKCYSSLETKAFKRKKYDTHNFYLYLWGSAGIMAIILFVLLIVYSFHASKSLIELFFWIIIALGNLTESILTRSYGITFFLFFIILFYLHKKHDAENLNNNTSF